MQWSRQRTPEHILVDCLLAEGVECVFGLPGEGSAGLFLAAAGSPLRVVLTRGEQSAAMMACAYGRVSGKPGVCLASQGMGAIRLLPGMAEAQAGGAPVVAVAARESFRWICADPALDADALFAPVTKWAAAVPRADLIPDMLRKAFATARRARPGPVYVSIPGDLSPSAGARPWPLAAAPAAHPDPVQVRRAAERIRAARYPLLVAGSGLARAGAGESLRRFAECVSLPVAVTRMAKGALPDDHPLLLGVIGLLANDAENFGLAKADLLILAGCEAREFALPELDAAVLSLHDGVDPGVRVDVPVEGDIAATLDMLRDLLPVSRRDTWTGDAKIAELLRAEREGGARDGGVPLSPRRVAADIRSALAEDDIALVDAGLAAFWMALLFPARRPGACLFPARASSMGFALPGALGARLARPTSRVLAVTGDGSFLASAHELETALRERLALVVLIWENGSYGMTKWEMERMADEHAAVDFCNPDFVAYAESFGAKGYRIEREGDLLPVLRQALADDTVSVICCPVADGAALAAALGEPLF